MPVDPGVGIDRGPPGSHTLVEEVLVNGLAIIAVVVGGVVAAGALCWIVIEAALRRARSGGRGRRD